MNSPDIYFISGLGLDERIFFKLNINSEKIHHIKWIEPEKNERIESYSFRMMEQIKHRGNVVLIGLSFGGMIAIEIAKLMKVRKVIIISSIKTKEEIPLLFKIIRYFPIYKWTSPKMRRRTREYWGVMFGLVNKESLDFFEEMFELHSETYKSWGIKQIAIWGNTYYPSHLKHIHGTKDLIFPHKKIENIHLVEGGNHGMVVTHGEVVSSMINNELDELSQEDYVD